MPSATRSAPEEIEQAMEACTAGRSLQIPASVVRKWMGSYDNETLGAVYAFLSKERYCSCIRPPLSRDEVHSFLLRYYGKCMSGDFRGEWIHGRYEAGWEFAGFLRHACSLLPESEYVVKQSVQMLAELYLAGGEDVRQCIVTAILEHLLNDKNVRPAFGSWKRNAVLHEACQLAGEKGTGN